jgi:hypothetical protein
MIATLGSTAHCCRAEDAAPAPSEAKRLWEQGQSAMTAGDPDGALVAYKESLRLDRTLTRNHLSLAAAYLAKGMDEAAAKSMATYLELEPDHFAARAHYAELLARLERPAAARAEFEHFIADIQDKSELAEAHLIHTHGRIMEIAEGQGDEYGEHLHRGIGLYLLAVQSGRLPKDGSQLDAESLLCKAAGELTLARQERPDEARPYWYLHMVWNRLARRQPAARWLHFAEVAAATSDLTPSEKRDLRLACLQREREQQRK